MESVGIITCFVLVFVLCGNWQNCAQLANASDELDPTTLVPDTHGSLVQEKEETASKKSNTFSNKPVQQLYNYRLNRDEARTVNKSPATQSNAIVYQSATGVQPNTANINYTGQQQKAVQQQNLQNPVQQTLQNTVQQQNSVDLTQKYIDQTHNSVDQTQNIGQQTQNILPQSQALNKELAGAGPRADNKTHYSSIDKALKFYESIVANAKKLLDKDNRGIQAVGYNNTELSYNRNSVDEDQLNICQSDECKSVAKYIKNSIDVSVDPCEDFYTFSCGGWKKDNDIPESENEITAFTKLTKKIEYATHELLTAPAQSGESEALDKARTFFYSCMNTSVIERKGAKPALDFIKNISGWSMCGDKSWNEKKWNQYDVLKDIQSRFYPAPPFFTVEVTNDHLNSTKHLIKIDQSGLSLQREIYCKHSEIVEDYKEYMVQIVKLLGYNCENVTEEVKEIIEFEDMLAKATTPAEAKQAGTFRRINVHLLESIVPQFPWLKHLKHIFKSETKVNPQEIVLATTPVYLYKIANMIKKTPKRILSKYIVWQMLRDKISFLSSDFRKARAAFNEKMTGVKDRDPRWRTCTGVTNDNMGVPIGTLYVDKFFKETTKEKTHEMIQEIIKSFEKRIEKHDWIDGKTRKGILEKTASLVAKVGYATYILQPDELNKRFRKLQIGDDFFVNNLMVDRWIRTRLFGKLRKAVDKSKWPMFPQTINAMYQFYENEIVIPAGILQAPFYYEGVVPRSLSYGAIGSIIGHELTHGFDNTGRKFDKNGDIVKEWWSTSALKEFNKRATCIEKQYSKYKVQDKYPVKGKLTLGENIADNGGTKLAYDAYIDFLKNIGVPEQTLPGLEYTNKQLFFIGYAQEYCANVRSKTEYIATLSEIHAPSKFRVIGTLSNFKAFSDAFKCKKNDRMNPTSKCEVW